VPEQIISMRPEFLTSGHVLWNMMSSILVGIDDFEEAAASTLG
jgi:hypothetical protein